MPLFPRPRLTPPIVPFLPETIAYRDRITAAGSSISQDTLQAADRFVRDCYNAGIWSKLTEVAPLAGSNLAAAMQKLKYSSTASMIAVNLVNSDFTERGAAAGGIAGDGSTKYIRFQYDVATFTTLSSHISVYLREDEAAAITYWFGSSSASDNVLLGTPAGTNQQGCLGGLSAAALNAAAPTKGWYFTQRDAATNLFLCKDNVSVASSATSFNSGMASSGMFALARNNAGSPSNYTAKRISFLTIGQALTVTERTALYNAILAFNNHLAR